jgi:Holliday junction resolvase RusA-like endonuclease
MTQQIAFTVHGPPVPKARARVVSSGEGANRKTRSFTPGKTAAYESLVSMRALEARSKTRQWPWQDKDARFGITISVYRSAERGDLDNFEKSIWDGCNKVIWHDDRQVIRRGEGGVFRCPKGFERVEVRIWVVEVDK